jgi:hypothetical protein
MSLFIGIDNDPKAICVLLSCKKPMSLCFSTMPLVALLIPIHSWYRVDLDMEDGIVALTSSLTSDAPRESRIPSLIELTKITLLQLMKATWMEEAVSVALQWNTGLFASETSLRRTLFRQQG